MAAPGSPVSNIYLFYESTNNGFALLNGSLLVAAEKNIELWVEEPSATATSASTAMESFPVPTWTWESSSNKLQASNQGTGLQFGAPFASFSGDGVSESVFAGKYDNGSFSDRGLIVVSYYDGSFITCQYDGFDWMTLCRS